ncbi:hypothetical protein CSC15_1691 [Escherichia coli]|nr:hypothetical protein CSC15_1691 [Escherichia coli]
MYVLILKLNGLKWMANLYPRPEGRGFTAHRINRKLFWSDTASYPLKALSLT